MVYCVGLTGTMASGKSTAAAYFKSLGVTVLSADACAKSLTLAGLPAFEEIKQHFGSEIIATDGELNRRALRQRIATDISERRWLEACLHPKIRHALNEAIQHVTSAYCVIEIPLLTERDDYPYLNRVLLIESTETQQIKRIIMRDTCTREEALALLAIQPYRAKHRALADDCITNNTSVHLLEKKLAKLHAEYLAAARLFNLQIIK